MYVCMYVYMYALFGCPCKRPFQVEHSSDDCAGTWTLDHRYGRFPKFHRAFLGRDPGTLKSDIVSKKHPQLICSDLRLSN